MLIVVAAKLGRRSRKMRESIAEACKTIEDNQTAQALHGLLSLKADSTSDSVANTSKSSGDVSSSGSVSEGMLVRQADNSITLVPNSEFPNIIIEQPHAITSPTNTTDPPTIRITTTSSTDITIPAGLASATLAGAAQQVLETAHQKKAVTDSEQVLQQRLEQARQMNSEVFNVRYFSFMSFFVYGI